MFKLRYSCLSNLSLQYLYLNFLLSMKSLFSNKMPMKMKVSRKKGSPPPPPNIQQGKLPPGVKIGSED